MTRQWSKARNLPGFFSAFKGIAILVAAVLACSPLWAKEKAAPKNPNDPYVTAESEKPPQVAASDLAYRAIVFDKFDVPAQWEKSARKVVDPLTDNSIARLKITGAFSTVSRLQEPLPQEPYLRVKCALRNYRIVSGGSRFLVGIAAGTSYMTFDVQIFDQGNALLFERDLTTEDNVFSGTFGSGDRGLTSYLANALADYVALRARKDMGASMLPLDDKKGSATQAPAGAAPASAAR